MKERKLEIPMDDKHLAQFGENTARTLCLEGKVQARHVRQVIRRSTAAVERVWAKATEWSSHRQDLPQEAEWLLDNWYLAQREGRDAAECFRQNGSLRAVSREGRQAMILELGRALVWAGEVTPERIGRFLDHAQEVRPLTERELSLFIPALKGALLERLESACRDLESMLLGRGVFEGEEEALRARKAGRLTMQQESVLLSTEAEHQRLSQAMQTIFNGLRILSTANLGPLLEEQSRVERVLRKDPSGDYVKMDDNTRAHYRREVCRLAKRKGIPEHKAAQLALELAAGGTGEERHVGWFLFHLPLGDEPIRSAGTSYVAAVLLPTLFLVLLAGFLLNTPLVAVLLLLPVSDIVKNFVDFLVVRLFPPRNVHRMALKDGVPPEGKSLCVVASLLTDPESGQELAALLERYRLANRDTGPNLFFGILADLPDSDLPMGEAGRSCVEAAAQAVDGLNQKYGGGFYLFFRRPVFLPGDERYMGWERKRGALLELVRLLRGGHTGLEVRAGNQKDLCGIRYVITLDSDTSLNVGAARELIGAMLHPLNRPRLDRKRKIVVSGYGILQPRVGVELGAANKSQFSRIFAGQGGVDPYGSTTSDVYHDLFDQGTYTGKGIFDVEAFYTCLNGRFPRNTLLSHDLIEGSYLHAGLIGDVELTDGYPYKVTSYFARLHRWVRGDWQLLPWLGRSVTNEDGERVENPIPPMAKWKIFDNLRRSLSPVCTLLALLLGMCISGPAFTIAALAAVCTAASNLLLSGAELAFRRGQGLRARYHSTIIAGFGGVLLQTLVQLLFLPYHACTCASAIGTALWRRFVSHRGLLAWVTAADAERRAGDGIQANFHKQWPAVVVGLLAIGGSLFPAGAALGLIWTCSPIFAWALSKPIVECRSITAADRAFFLHEASLIWKYFSDFLRPEDHFLPPDNFQERPDVGLARRTSPTNIGMALLCVLAAVDLELLPKAQAVTLLDSMLETLETLPKWNGHFYNWYDTSTAKPLSPRYVSTVDSGNLCGCLIALREGLYEWGEAILARRAEALSDHMNFSLLFDKERKLFYIGWDAEKEAYTQGWYDLMASEARQTSYLAVARGEVDARHWRRLGRMLVKDGDFAGMASWTGTMFEYFMPNLLLPCEPNSLMYESLAFCLSVQRRHTAKLGVPWGISESCFYAFDPGMNYQYKAHGVQMLGLKRGLDRELVISPYSSFLALLLAPGSGGRNLRRLRDMGMEGTYGLYEAADFTGTRLTGDRDWETVRCYMAHHLGMSLISIDNALRENVMQERFMRDCAMSAYRELLQEKVPVGAAIPRRQLREIPDKPRRLQGPRFERSGTGFDQTFPACHIVSNGAYTVFCTDAGASASRYKDISLVKAEFRKSNQPAGISLFLRAGDGGLYPLTIAPEYCSKGEFAWKFSGSCAQWTRTHNNICTEITLRVPEQENGELREVEIFRPENEPFSGELVCYCEPVLASQRDYDAHPAFSKLSVESTAREEGVVFTRRSKEQGRQLTLAICWDSPEATFDTSRERALGRSGLRGLKSALYHPADGSLGAVLDPCLLVRFPVVLEAGGRFRLRLSLAAAEGEENAYLAAQRILKLPRETASGYLDGLLRVFHMTGDHTLQAFQLLEYLAFPSPREAESAVAPSQEGLWPFGISGDLPIATVSISDEGHLEECLKWARLHKLLNRLGFAFDLVFLLPDGGDYRRPVRTALLDGWKALGVEYLIGTKGGLHLVEESAAEPVLSAAAVRLEPSSVLGPRSSPHVNNIKRLPFTLIPGSPQYEFLPGGVVTFTAGKHLPFVGWSQILANPSFGWTTDETGCGHLWYQNARENQLTPWHNDPLMVGGPERVGLRRKGMEVSLFADTDGLDSTVWYGQGYVRWEKSWGDLQMRTTAFVPLNVPARVFLLEFDGDLNGVDLSYTVQPLLAASKMAARYIESTCKGNYIVIKNPWNRSFWPQAMLAGTSAGLTSWCDGIDGMVEACWPANHSMVFVAGGASTQEEAKQILALVDPGRAETAFRHTIQEWERLTRAITVDTPDERLNAYLNGWAAYQTIACRLFGRTSRYQGGGAYGFRDQLQDVCAVLLTAPELARSQLLSACAHQFEEGDVQHWWHPALEQGADKGVRTRISDDLLWLPYTLCEYLEKTADRAILDEQVHLLSAPILEDGEQERYFQPSISQETVSVYTHAVRAVECAIRRGTGTHGLALMGAGDWNDGLNHVGRAGKGESTWLTWFMVYVLERFSGIAEALGDVERAVRWRETAGRYREAANAAWDGAWFLRGYYDDGSTLGSAADEECQIDSIAQSWAVLAGGDAEKTGTALRSALKILFDEESGIVRLFTPSFHFGEKDPGYIRGYLPGIRENGGQYTHAAVWLAIACFRAGLPEDGMKLLSALLPSGRDNTVYKAEPYVLPADVYANPAHKGRGGWSWYTGAAGWYYRAALQELLGLTLGEGRLFLRPNLPKGWKGYSATWRTGRAELRILVQRGGKTGTYFDGKPLNGGLDLSTLEGGHTLEQILSL